MITLKEVARAAGVSVATVSCCLSGAKNVKPSTKAKVMAAVEELGYIPNFAARSLKAAGRNEIGVVLTDIDDWYHAEILKGITSCVQREDYNVSIAFSNNLSHLECHELDRFVGRGLSGLIIATCQPHNTEFFHSRLEEHRLSAVFVEREPPGIDCNFIGFDNYHMLRRLMEQLLEKGYRRVALVSGPGTLSSESDCLRGYRAACQQDGLAADPALICETNMSKEDAFRAAIGILKRSQAVIATSTGIAKGVLEAAGFLGIAVGADFPIITLGEECWNNSNKLPGVFHTARPAFDLGVAATALLMENMRSPRLFEKRHILMQDNCLRDTLPLSPPRREEPPAITHSRPVLRALVMDLPTTHTLELLMDNYTRTNGVEIAFTSLKQDALLDAIVADNGRYDFYMYDLPWTDYLVQNGLIEDITTFVEDNAYIKDSLLPENLEGCRLGGRYFGIPIVGGSQIMFYRKDLFEDLSLRKAFEQRYKVSLRPPLTWTEFNGVAEFFTRAFTPGSPVEFGTSFAGNNNQELAPELLIRLWASGGTLFDSGNRVRLNSPANVKAMRIALQTLQYVERGPLQTSIRQTVQDFCAGKTAMLITYSEYAAQISSIHSPIEGRVGYSQLPGRTPISVGWNLGVSRQTGQLAHVYSFFGWLCQRNISYYLTIIDGQSAAVHPYRNNELLKLYPWLGQTLDSFRHSQPRRGPYRRNALVIPQSKLEDILCRAFQTILTGTASIEEVLEAAHVEMKYICKAYGY